MRPVRPAPGNSSKFGLIVLLIIGICFAGLLYQYLHRANEANSNTRVAPEVITVKEPETALPEPLEEITPTPKPGPDVERNDSSGIVALPEPEPVAVEPVKEPEAKFDVADFLENKARKIMRERSATIIAANKTELGKNLSAYERELQAEARRQGRAILRDSYSESIKTFVEECRKDGNMIPEDIPEEIENLEVASSKHAEYVEAQEAISEKLKRDLSKLSDTYILGITKQIERLKDSGDPTAVKMLNEEIDTVHDDEDFFPNLMMGEE